MGNEQVCCLQNENNLMNQTQIKITQPINYPLNKSTISNQIDIQQGINIAKRSKSTFSGKLNSNQKDQNDYFLKKSSQIVQTSQNIPQPNFASQHYIQNENKLQNLLQPQNPKNQPSSRHNQTFKDFQKVEDQNICINIHPNVSKLISLLRPLEKKLQSIDDKKVRKIRINNGKDIYKGQIDEVRFLLNFKYGKFCGIGMIVKQSGNILMGNFVKGLLQGQSFALFNDGSYYKGKMKDSLAHDQNGYFYSQNFTYIGGFENNLFHGKGQQIGIDHYFQGIYEDNLRKSGILAWGIINSRESLIVEKNKKQKQIIKIYRDSLRQSDVEKSVTNQSIQIKNCQFIYQGQFDVHQLFTEKGKLQQPKGTYIGDFYRGMKHGKGEYLYAEQIRYVGQYENDCKSGYGILYNCDETVAYEGQWRNGLPDGKGFSYDLDGKKTQGIFIEGINSKILSNQ